MPALHSRRLISLAMRVAAALAVSCSAATALAAPPVTWALAPARIRVYLSAEASPEWPAARRADLARELTSRSQSLAGALWQLDVVEAPKDLAAAARSGLDRAEKSAAITKTIESLVLAPEGPTKESFDKFLFVHLASTSAGEEVRAREWDVYTGTWGPVMVRRAPQGGLAHAAFSALRAASGSLARLELPSAAAAPGPGAPGAAKAPEPAAAGRVFLRLRGGDLTPRDSSLAPAQPGDVLRVVRRIAGSAGKLASSQELPWTYLTVEKVTGAQATCRVYSHFRDPLGQNLAPREEWVAVGVGNTGQPTTLRVAGTPAPGTPVGAGNGPPVAGLEVLVYSPTGGKAYALGRTARDGTLAIPPADSALRVILLRRGPDLVARYPLIPGWPASVEVTLTADDTRMAVAASAAAIELRVLELVTRREIELARLRVRVKEKKKAEAEEIMKGFQDFDAKRAELDKWILDEKNRLTTADPETQQHVNQVFTSLSTALARHLDPGAVQQLATELATAAAATETPAPEVDPGAAPPATTTTPTTPGGKPVKDSGNISFIIWPKNAQPRPNPSPQDAGPAGAVTAIGGEISVIGYGEEWLETLGIPSGVDDTKFAQLAPHLKGLKNIQSVRVQSILSEASLASLKEIPGVKAIHLTGGLTDSGLAHFAGMTTLESLHIDNSPITDAGLGHLRGLTRLKALGLARTSITSAGLGHLAGLTELRMLRLSDTQVDDVGIGALAPLVKLEKLNLAGSRVTDASLPTIARFVELKELDLRRLAIRDGGLSQIGALAKLQSVILDDTQVTDAGMPALAKLTALGCIGLDRTQVTDTGLAQLKGLPNLMVLSISETKISDPSAATILSFPKLRQLLARKTAITPAGFAELEKSPQKFAILNFSDE